MQKKNVIFVVGGVMSGVGKGVTTASIAKLIQDRGYTVTALKVDPYINVDAGTMNPTEHGEVFVLADGDETDQDMGNYERYLGQELSRINYMTTGRVYKSVIERERAGAYEGKCVEVVPHIPLEIIARIEEAISCADADVAVVEIGGTVGEYQNILFLEAARMMRRKKNVNACFVLVSYLPVPDKVGEMKTKPTQTAARTLNATGIQADFIVARADRDVDQKRKEKIAMFCDVREDDVISAPDVDSIYAVPEIFEEQQFSERLLKRLGLSLQEREGRANAWDAMVARLRDAQQSGVRPRIGIAGKYFSTGDFVLADSYISVIEAVKHAGTVHGVNPEIVWLDSEVYETDTERMHAELSAIDALIVPGGFGTRGIEGKIAAIGYARMHKIPFLGICYGMQMLVTEYARNVAGMMDAHTTEIDPATKHPVVDILPEQREKLNMEDFGGSMRLGSYDAHIMPRTRAAALYDAQKITERHRHRYEVNPAYVSRLRDAGLIFSATSPDGTLMEIAELPEEVHPYFIAAQFHPEFLSRPLAPHPLFVGLLAAAKKCYKNR